MDAKLTPEQAKSTLGWIKIQCDSELKKEIDRIIKYIESLARDAELGRAAKEAIGNKSPYPCQYPLFIDGSSICKMCTWTDFCRLRAGKGGE